MACTSMLKSRLTSVAQGLTTTCSASATPTWVSIGNITNSLLVKLGTQCRATCCLQLCRSTQAHHSTLSLALHNFATMPKSMPLPSRLLPYINSNTPLLVPTELLINIKYLVAHPNSISVLLMLLMA